MNAYLIQKLVLKDWYLQRIPILLSLAGVAVSMALMLFGHDAGFMIGLIALISILIGFGANLSIATIVNERKEQTLPFVMSLPISHREIHHCQDLTFRRASVPRSLAGHRSLHGRALSRGANHWPLVLAARIDSLLGHHDRRNWREYDMPHRLRGPGHQNPSPGPSPP